MLIQSEIPALRLCTKMGDVNVYVHSILKMGFNKECVQEILKRVRTDMKTTVLNWLLV